MIFLDNFPVRIVRVLHDAAAVAAVQGFEVTPLQRKRLDGITTYVACEWVDDPAVPFVADCAVMRADGGYHEIAEAVAKVLA